MATPTEDRNTLAAYAAAQFGALNQHSRVSLWGLVQVGGGRRPSEVHP